MANRKRKEKELPEHLTYLPEVPDKQKVGIEASLKSALKRAGKANSKSKALIDHYHIEYEKEPNPLLVWDAYSRARSIKEPIPEWVLEYFDKVAKKILKAEKPKDFLDIMGFKWKTSLRDGGAQAWKQYHSKVIRHESVGHVLNYLKQYPKKSISDACEYAANLIFKKWGVKRKPDTIEGYNEKYK